MTATTAPVIQPDPAPQPDPVSGGAWLRTAAGDLLPADQDTALRAGLPWPPAATNTTAKE